MYLGIDEAGRGCVIGPMVMCGFLVGDEGVIKLEELQVKDSKALTPKRREEFAGVLRDIGGRVILKIIPPSEIDEFNINLLELKYTAEIIKESGNPFQDSSNGSSSSNGLHGRSVEAFPEAVYLDAPVHPSGIKNYKSRLNDLLEKEDLTVKKIYAENKADVKFSVVSAASIMAKVRRDAEIDELRKEFGDFGSGYPGDPKTISFLKHLRERGDIIPIVRKKWKIKALTNKLE